MINVKNLSELDCGELFMLSGKTSMYLKTDDSTLNAIDISDGHLFHLENKEVICCSKLLTLHTDAINES